ncbi:hypothetical protein Bhyg_02423 [Pseudolycoriella hygida]|uniref:Uncharacterized protein n=1 Tax=Pseudolycoriella hygida TaxID=35572 RepID=A0A9Q0NBT4_9DIPT|nr:hypothetical protein Bhyg_02423 [Pseudolycoriella hygida]
MHFWIDKRSQSCGFGRARVAASLSGTGIGFGHHPRRMGGKSMSMLAPIHRFPAVDCRPYRPHREASHINNHRHEQGDLIQQRLRDNIRSQQYRAQQSAHSQQSAPPIQPQLHLSDCHPIGQYGPSLALELEQGTLGGPTIARTQNVRAGPESQLLPSHLKCGMWASLALATVFVAVFQGTGLEFLIFCGFCTTVILFAFVISMCNRPRDLIIVPPVTTPAAIEARVENPQEIVTVESTNETAAQPPPYHIAILLPENSKQTEESPPSYDKLVI